jgi:Rieske Fe-S protein
MKNRDGTETEPRAAACLTRRVMIAGAAAGLAASAPARADDGEKPGADDRPKPGDLLVYAEGDDEGKVISLAALPLGGPPALAWPMDPASMVVRDGSRLNQVLVVRLDPSSLDQDTIPHAAQGAVAYSAVCMHAGCPVTGWVEDQGITVFKCFCHNSEYDPRRNATVVFGPAPHALAALPLTMAADRLVVAEPFIGRVGPRTS